MDSSWYNQWKQSTQQPWAPTQLSPADEYNFQKWMLSLPWFRGIESGAELKGTRLLNTMLGPDNDYDYRGAYASGINPTLYPYDNTYHWPSSTDQGRMLKSPNHPTAWMEYFMRGSDGIDPNQFGLSSPENARTWLNQYNSVLNAFTW